MGRDGQVQKTIDDQLQVTSDRLVKATQPAQLAQNVEPDQPVQLAQNVQPDQPVQLAQNFEPAQPVQLAQNVKPDQLAQLAQNFEPAQLAQNVKPDQPSNLHRLPNLSRPVHKTRDVASQHLPKKDLAPRFLLRAKTLPSEFRSNL